MRVLNEGTRLADRYTLKRRLGRGAASETWLADDRRSGSLLALKFLSEAASATEAGRERFHREWRTASRLMHAHIVRVFEYHDDPEGPYYALQFVDGATVAILAGEPPEVALRPVALIADALRYAHGKGIVHRDIKAANILLDPRGAPMLIDFGVAGQAGAEEHAGGGTPIASSPQQAAGEPPEPADDVYALGVLMHELVTGQPPGPAGADRAAMPLPLAELVDAMLAREAARRPTAEAVAGRLSELGIDPGPAPRRLLGATVARADDDAAEKIEAIRPFRRTRGEEASPTGAAGVSPRLIWGALAVLLALALAVVFWLPSAVDRDRAEPESTATGETDGPGVDPDAVIEDDRPAASDEAAADAEAKPGTDDALGELLALLERLRGRGVERWGGQRWEEALAVYEDGDRAYLDRRFRRAGERYRQVIELLEPLEGRADQVFRETLAAARAAFAAEDPQEALRLYDLALAVTPEHAAARREFERAQRLDEVLALMERGRALERSLDLVAARDAFEQAGKLDPAWEPAREALARVTAALEQRTFEQRMTEGLGALAAGDFSTARAAFNAARAMRPDSQEPADGLLRVDQEIRLASIRRMETEAVELERNEQWQDAIARYEQILEIDDSLQFAQDGLSRSRERAAMHERLQAFISDPDRLSAPATMRAATNLLLEASRTTPMGPRLEDQKNELSRLLKRAATPLTVRLVSDNATEVSIFRVGKLGTFESRELELRPGAYVALGSRPGFRDVRLEFRVAPEIELQPIVIMCEERI